MGVRIQPRTAVLIFDPEQFPEYAGVEIRTRLDITTDAFFELEAMMERVSDGADSRERLRAMLQFFIDNIALSWNLEDENGNALPLDIQTVMSLPPKLTLRLIPMWKEAATGVEAPLGEPSPDGGTSEGPSTEMEE